MRIICKQTLLWLGVCLLAGVVSGWAQQDVITYNMTSVPTTVGNSGDSEVLGSVRFQVSNVSIGTIHGSPNVLSQALQIVLGGISCDNNSLTGMTLTFGSSATPPGAFSGHVTWATGGYDANNSVVPNGCVLGLDVNLPATAESPYGLPVVGDWFQVDGIRARMEFDTGVAIGGAINASAILASSVGSGEIAPPNLVQVASPFTVLNATVLPGVYVNCVNSPAMPATISVTEPYQADFVDYYLLDSSSATLTTRPIFGATDIVAAGTQILLTVSNVPPGATLTFPLSVVGNGSVPKPAGDAIVGDTGDHLVLASSATIVGSTVPNSATVLYNYTCYNATVCDTAYESFGITPTVTNTSESVTGTIMIQAQVVPYDVTATTPVGGVASFTTPPNANPVRPRWSDPPTTLTAFITLAPCSTTLLFPWVVDVPGFDTGVIINNTTQDYTNAAGLPNSVLIAAPNFPFVEPTSPEQGTCTLYYFPSNEAPALYQTSPVLSTGQTWSWIQSSSPFAGLTGYMMARCNFRYGHGYAAIGQGTSVGSLQFTEAYLALLIPDPVILGYRADAADGWVGYDNTGEGLDH